MNTGFLHPGAMGATIAGACRPPALWAGAGRSARSMARAAAAGLTDAGTVGVLTASCDTIVSVVPPGAALEVARQVADLGFAGRYVDVNAVSPATARTIGDLFDRFVDGAIIGTPPAGPGRVRLYLAGAEADDTASLWSGSDIEVRVLAGAPGAASALKVAYAGWTKASAALLLAMRAYAAAEAVEDDLVAEWRTSLPDLVARSEGAALDTAPKAWRFVGEMHEIASALAAVGLPSGFHDAAAAIYESMNGFRDTEATDLADVLDAIAGTAT